MMGEEAHKTLSIVCLCPPSWFWSLCLHMELSGRWAWTEPHDSHKQSSIKDFSHQPPLISLYDGSNRAWIQHDPHTGSKSLWWQVVLEFRSHDSRVSMRSRYLAPNCSYLRPLSLFRCSVDVGYSLSKVETFEQKPLAGCDSPVQKFDEETNGGGSWNCRQPKVGLRSSFRVIDALNLQKWYSRVAISFPSLVRQMFPSSSGCC